MENFLKLFLFINIFFLKLFRAKCECDRNSPILTSNGCEMKYCSKENFDSGECKIDNSIIKVQWINDIILFNSEKFKFGSLAINSKGDLVFECSVKEATGIRLFYWLNKDGSYFFENEKGEKVPTKIIIVKNDDLIPLRYDSTNFFITLNNGKECLISISLWETYTELYDFEDNEISFVYTIDFTNYNIYSTINSFIEIENNYSKEYYFTFVGQEKADTYNYNQFFLMIQSYSFTDNRISLNNGYSVENKNKKEIYNVRTVSSFKTDLKLIFLFYLNNNIYIAELYDENFNQKTTKDIDSIDSHNEDNYYKSIILKIILEL